MFHMKQHMIKYHVLFIFAGDGLSMIYLKDDSYSSVLKHLQTDFCDKYRYKRVFLNNIIMN